MAWQQQQRESMDALHRDDKQPFQGDQPPTVVALRCDVPVNDGHACDPPGHVRQQPSTIPQLVDQPPLGPSASSRQQSRHHAAVLELAAAHSHDIFRMALFVRRTLGLLPGEVTSLSCMLGTPHLKGQEVRVQGLDGSVLGRGKLVDEESVSCSCQQCGGLRRFKLSEFAAHCGISTQRSDEAVVLEEIDRSLWQMLDLVNNPHVLAAVEVAGVDPHDDQCHRCGDGGELLCCDGCTAAYHQQCAGLESVPEGDWFCPLCVAEKAQVDVKAVAPGRSLYQSQAASTWPPSQLQQQEQLSSVPPRASGAGGWAVLQSLSSSRGPRRQPAQQRLTEALTPSAETHGPTCMDGKQPYKALSSAGIDNCSAPATEQPDAKRVKQEGGDEQLRSVHKPVLPGPFTAPAAPAAAAAAKKGTGAAAAAADSTTGSHRNTIKIRLLVRNVLGGHPVPNEGIPAGRGNADIGGSVAAGSAGGRQPHVQQLAEGEPTSQPSCHLTVHQQQQPATDTIQQQGQQQQAPQQQEPVSCVQQNAGGASTVAAGVSTQRALFMATLALLQRNEVPQKQLEAFLRHYALLPAHERQQAWLQLKACGSTSEALTYVSRALQT